MRCFNLKLLKVGRVTRFLLPTFLNFSYFTQKWDDPYGELIMPEKNGALEQFVESPKLATVHFFAVEILRNAYWHDAIFFFRLGNWKSRILTDAIHGILEKGKTGREPVTCQLTRMWLKGNRLLRAEIPTNWTGNWAATPSTLLLALNGHPFQSGRKGGVAKGNSLERWRQQFRLTGSKAFHVFCVGDCANDDDAPADNKKIKRIWSIGGRLIRQPNEWRM